MTKDEALAFDLALEALETLMLERGSIYEKAITAIKQARSAPVQEPVTWGVHDQQKLSDMLTAQRQWVGLTEPELRAVLEKTNHMITNAMHGPFWPDLEQACRAIEAKLREKNTGETK